MRKAYQNVNYLIENDVFIGVSLGYDFCAEHEWGIKGLKRTFGIDSDLIGIKGRTITKGADKTLYKEKGDLALIRTDNHYHPLADKSFDECLPRDLEHMREDKDIHTAWSEEDFCIVGKVDLIKQLKEGFDNLNITFAFISDATWIKGSSLCVLLTDKLDKETIDQMRYVDQKALDLIKYEKKIGLTKLKLSKFKSKYANDFDETKHKYWMALSPRWTNYKNEDPESKTKNNTEFDIMYWVNYGDDDVYGWFTVEQIKEWLSNPDTKLRSLVVEKV